MTEDPAAHRPATVVVKGDTYPMLGQLLPRRFALRRSYHASGVSGTGLVAYGTVYPTGRTTLAWCVGEVASVTVYDSPEQVEKIHGHDGTTVLVWIDAHGPAPASRQDKPCADGQNA